MLNVTGGLMLYIYAFNVQYKNCFSALLLKTEEMYNCSSAKENIITSFKPFKSVHKISHFTCFLWIILKFSAITWNP